MNSDRKARVIKTDAAVGGQLSRQYRDDQLEDKDLLQVRSVDLVESVVLNGEGLSACIVRFPRSPASPLWILPSDWPLLFLPAHVLCVEPP